MTFHDRLQAVQSATAANADRANDLYRQIVERLRSTNAVGVYTRIVGLEQLSRHAPVEYVYGFDAVVDFLGGLITSLPEAEVNARLEAPVSPTEVFAIDELLREFAVCDAAARVGELARADKRHLDMRFLLSLEQQLDRTAGYTQHLRHIVDAVLQPMSEMSRRTLGTSPDLVLAAADRHASRREAMTMEMMSSSSPPSASAGGQLGSSVKPPFALLEIASAAIRQDVMATVREELRLGEPEASALLAAVSTPLGSQDVRSLSSPNRLRCFPVIPLPDGTFLWTRPYDFVHEALDWFDQLIAARNATKLRARFFDLRSRAAEGLAASALDSVFGHDRVLRSVEYQLTNGDWAETDIVVDLAPAMVVAEVKANRLTSPGRDGRVDRVETKFEELVEAPLSQSSRAKEAFQKAVPARDRRTQRPWVYDPPREVLRCVILLERVDPFVTYAAKEHQAQEVDAWIVSLADLLAVVEILQDPAELYSYITTRSDQTAQGSPVIIMESDALGAWLKTREGAWAAPAEAVFQLAYSSDRINAYFTQQEMHARHPDLIPTSVQRPTTGIPPAVLESVNRLLYRKDPTWPTVARAVGAVKSSNWRVVQRDIDRARRSSPNRTDRRALQAAARGRNLGGLLIKAGDRDAAEVDGCGVTLTYAMSAT